MTVSFWESSTHHHPSTPLSYGLTAACMFNCHTNGDAQKYGNYVIVTSHITSHVIFGAKPRVALIIRAESRPGKTCACFYIEILCLQISSSNPPIMY